MNIRVKILLIIVLACLVSTPIQSMSIFYMVHESDTIDHNNGATVSLSDIKKMRLLSNDTLQRVEFDTINNDTQGIDNKVNMRGKTLFYPSPEKAMWYGLLFPGLGQVYNRKYWKLPIVYGGFVGLAYGISWNDKYYQLYKQYYRDITDSNPNSKSYEELYEKVDPSVVTEAQIKNSMDNLRRARDLFIIGTVAFYAITVLDAFVDASLANFDISPDLTLRVAPTMIQIQDKKINFALKMNLNF